MSGHLAQVSLSASGGHEHVYMKNHVCRNVRDICMAVRRAITRLL
jgi:hypothetical protein